VCAVLQAVLDVVASQGLQPTPTAIFAAVMSSLDRPATQASAEVCSAPICSRQEAAVHRAGRAAYRLAVHALQMSVPLIPNAVIWQIEALAWRRCLPGTTLRRFLRVSLWTLRMLLSELVYRAATPAGVHGVLHSAGVSAGAYAVRHAALQVQHRRGRPLHGPGAAPRRRESSSCLRFITYCCEP